MGRPASKAPTAAELQVLEVLWRNGPSTLREIQQALPAELTRAAVHTRLETMLVKKLLRMQRRAKSDGGSVYSPISSRDGVMGQMFRRLISAFGGSPRLLLQGLLRGGHLNERDLRELREELRRHRKGGQP
jgi:predicted transcriptional regulator